MIERARQGLEFVLQIFCGHMPHIAAQIGQSSTVKQGNAGQQPSSFTIYTISLLGPWCYAHPEMPQVYDNHVNMPHKNSKQMFEKTKDRLWC